MIAPREHGKIVGAHIKGLHETPVERCERCRFSQKRCACGRLDYGPLQRMTFAEFDPVHMKKASRRRMHSNAERDRLRHEHQTTKLHEGPPKRFVKDCPTCEMQVGIYVMWFLRNLTTPASDPFTRRPDSRNNPFQPTEYRRRR